MKDDKFVLIGTVCLIVLFRFWGVFFDITANSTLTSMFNITERQIESEVKQQNTKDKTFVGCGSGFSSEKYMDNTNGKMDVRYKAQNIVTCDCLENGSVITKKVIYEYSYEPNNVEMDCNSRCEEICVK